MDEKEKLMSLHYKRIIEDELFDEYDILGFLIFARNTIKNNRIEKLKEFADFVAHRERKKGEIMSAIQGGAVNNYKTYEGSKT